VHKFVILQSGLGSRILGSAPKWLPKTLRKALRARSTEWIKALTSLNEVGVAGFEPTASSSRTKRATKLRYTPVQRGLL
jgi:hypothetical protein